MNVLIVEFCLLSVMLVILWLLVYVPRQRERQRFRGPFTERTLRPPGESLRRKLLKLDNRINDRMFLLFSIICFTVGCAFGEAGISGQIGLKTYACSVLAIVGMC